MSPWSAASKADGSNECEDRAQRNHPHAPQKRDLNPLPDGRRFNAPRGVSHRGRRHQRHKKRRQSCAPHLPRRPPSQHQAQEERARKRHTPQARRSRRGRTQRGESLYASVARNLHKRRDQRAHQEHATRKQFPTAAPQISQPHLVIISQLRLRRQHVPSHKRQIVIRATRLVFETLPTKRTKKNAHQSLRRFG